MKTSTSEGKHNTMNSSEPIRRFRLGRSPSPSITYTRTIANKDSQCSSSLCINKPPHTQEENLGPQIQHGEHQPNHT
ncbi:unnamed protein product [Schistosoma margrebowiei]|uniref:Uncharacterized protein n=1 Tax=Schistosoma margrebowiei TaxID=48269 RepID=A0A183MNE7_9TREM|nr:unnamed protein product [Schistosoma margrebowiei]